MEQDDREQHGARRPAIDAEALLCGLVLSPDTWSRNRFYRLYEDPRARRARRRALQVRSLIGLLRKRGGDLALLLHAPAVPGGAPETHDEDGDVEIVVDVPAMNLVRRTRLAPLELALVRYVLRVGDAGAQALDRARVEQALGRLMTTSS